MPLLVVKSKDGSRSYPILEGRPIYLGRAKECDIVLDSPSVSRRHAVILFKNGVCGVKDLGSFNGTILNNRAVQEPQQFTTHDILKISSFVIRLQNRRRNKSSRTGIIATAADTEATVVHHTPPTMTGTAFAAMASPPGDQTVQQFAPAGATVALTGPETPIDLDGASPDVTDFFRAPLPESLPPLPPIPEDPPPASAEAEALIPLIDPEEVPVLTFAMDDGPAPDTDGCGDEAADAAEPVEAEPAGDAGGGKPVQGDLHGVEPLPVSAEMRDRIEERLALYADPDAPATDKDALPRVFKACFTLALDEPLARELLAAHINPGRLFGSGLYLFVLRGMLAEDGVDEARRTVLDHEAQLAERLAADEFRRVYFEAAVRFLPEHESMPAAVRAFLRFGVVGVRHWWLRDRTMTDMLESCRDHAPLSTRFDPDDVVVLYADEYLAAVGDMECAPSPVPELEQLESLTLARMADRSYRRIVNAGSYNIRLKSLIASMESRLRRMDSALSALDASSDPAERSRRSDLARERQTLTAQVDRIKAEIMDSILESVQQAEGRFRRGELHMPTQDELLRRETAQLLDQMRDIAGTDCQFMPLILRERFPDDAVNTRALIRERVKALEERWEGLFHRILNPTDHSGESIRLRLPPVFVLCPACGPACLTGLAAHGMDGGHILLPIAHNRHSAGESALGVILSAYRPQDGEGQMA